MPLKLEELPLFCSPRFDSPRQQKCSANNKLNFDLPGILSREIKYIRVKNWLHSSWDSCSAFCRSCITERPKRLLHPCQEGKDTAMFFAQNLPGRELLNLEVPAVQSRSTFAMYIEQLALEVNTEWCAYVHYDGRIYQSGFQRDRLRFLPYQGQSDAAIHTRIRLSDFATQSLCFYSLKQTCFCAMISHQHWCAMLITTQKIFAHWIVETFALFAPFCLSSERSLF